MTELRNAELAWLGPVGNAVTPTVGQPAKLHAAMTAAPEKYQIYIGLAREAARLLCVHAEIADQVIAMIQGAALELRAGDPVHVIEQINALDYGLTIVRQTRIDSRAQALARAARIVCSVFAPLAPLLLNCVVP